MQMARADSLIVWLARKGQVIHHHNTIESTILTTLAELPAASRPKKQKILARNNLPSSPEKEEHETAVPPQASLYETCEDEERLAQYFSPKDRLFGSDRIREIQSKLEELRSENSKRKKATEEFDDEIKREQVRLTQKIEEAKTKLSVKQHFVCII